jgi:hypothetical protein
MKIDPRPFKMQLQKKRLSYLLSTFANNFLIMTGWQIALTFFGANQKVSTRVLTFRHE